VSSSPCFPGLQPAPSPALVDLVEAFADLRDLSIQLPALAQAEVNVEPESLPILRWLRGGHPRHGGLGAEVGQQGVDVERGGSELLEPELDEVVVDETALLGVGEHRADAIIRASQLLGILLHLPQASARGVERVDDSAGDLLREADRGEQLLEQIHGVTGRSDDRT
jgi:hypothetical protein